MKETILNIVVPFISIGLVYFISKRKKLSFKEDIGLVIPRVKETILWGLAFVLLLMLDDYLYKLNVSETIESWVGKYSTIEMVIRALGIVVLAPIAEELLFRGLLYARIKNTKLKIVGAVIIPALIFAFVHIQYSELLTIGIIFIDGVFYGLARHYSKSVVLAILLHAFANLGAILERLN
jgi:hypothetical protein